MKLGGHLTVLQVLQGLLLGCALFSVMQILYSARIGASERQHKWHVIGGALTMIFVLTMVISAFLSPVSS